MFGLFFDKINGKRKKSEDRPKELSPRNPTKPGLNNISPLSNTRINSLSPTSHNTQQFYFQQYSPQSTSTQNYFKASNEVKKSTITSTVFHKKFDDQTTNIITTPTLANTVIKSIGSQDIDHSKKEKPKPKPNFEFRPLDKDSFSQNMGSIAESTQEGSILAQNLPAPKTVNASKMPTRILAKKDDPYNMAFKVKNKDTGI